MAFRKSWESFCTRIVVHSSFFITYFQADLAEDFRLANLAKRTTKEKYQIYAIRTVANLIVLGLSALSAYLIFMAAQISIQVINSGVSLQ